MTIETDTLKTLERIEELLERSLASGKPQAQTRVSRTTRIAGGNRNADLNTAIFSATKQLDRLASSADNVTRSLQGTRKDAIRFGKSLRATTSVASAAFDGLNRAIDAAVKTVSQDSKVDKRKPDNTLGKKADAVSVQFGKLYSSTRMLNKAFGGLIGTIKGGVVPAQAKQKKSSDDVTAANKHQAKTGGFLDGAMGRLGVSLKGTGEDAEWLRGQFRALGSQLINAAIEVTKDSFALQARGISTSDSLFSLYGNAIRAGMSLEEYTALLQDNAAAVARFGDLQQFNDSLKTSTKSLAALGVFGPTANQLAASMRTNAVQLGVPISQVDDVAQAQIKTFAELRKSTLMTADGFKDLVQSIANNQNVQEELMGVVPLERAARQQQLIEIGALGHKMGLTSQASEQLKDALLAQRKATAEQRFKAAGYIRQAGAIAGMSAQESETLSRLARKKNVSQMSEEELKTFVALSGKMEQGIQAMMNSGNVQSEFIAEKLDENLQSTNYGALQKAAAAAVQQQQSGPTSNTEIGKQTTPFMQSIGNVLTTLSGFMKNPMADAMITFGSILAQTVVQSALLAVIARNTGGLPGMDMFSRMAGKRGGLTGPSKSALETSPSALKTGGKQPNRAFTAVKDFGIDAFKKTVDTIKAVGPAARKGFVNMFASVNTYAAGVGELAKQTKTGAATSVLKDIVGLGKSLVSAVGGGVSSAGIGIFNGVKGVIGGAAKLFVKGGPLAMLFGSIEELFTGELTAALGLGDGFGGRLLGAVTAAFNSFFTGFTRMIDAGVNWVMEGLGIDFRLNMTRWVDQATLDVITGLKVVGSFFSQGWNWFKSVLYDGIVSLLETLPFVSKDAPWLKAAKQNAAEARKQMKGEEDRRMELMNDYTATREALWEGETTTLRSLGEKQVQAQKDAASKSEKLMKTTVSNVVHGVESLGVAAQGTVEARRMTTAASPAPTAQPQVATPGPTKQPAVTPPEVNKQQADAAEKKAEQAAQVKEAVGQGASTEETVQVLKQQLQTLQQMLAYWQNQGDIGEMLLKAAGRPVLPSNEKLYAAALGRRTSS